MSSTCNKLNILSDDDLQKYVFNQQTWSQLNYRIELARRFASAFDADHLIVIDDVAMVTGESERMLSLSAIQGCDRSLLPTLWLSIGFEYGGTIIVYAPPNPIEIREFLKIRKKIEDQIQRTIPIRILYEGFNDILALYEKSSKDYTDFCLQYAKTPSNRPVFTSEYHIEQIKKHANEILTRIDNKRRTLIFPFEVTSYHVEQFSNYPHFILPDLPTNDKARHNFILREYTFTKLPRLFMVCVDGSILDSYEEYQNTLSTLSTSLKLNTSDNAKRFARSLIDAVNRLVKVYNFEAFIKLDALGAGGWSCLSPENHAIVYDQQLTDDERIDYIYNYIRTNVIDEYLPTHAVVEEYVHADIRPGNILADYTVCGLMINGRFFPTSVNLCGTENGQYIEQWTSSNAEYLNDTNQDWIQMFETYRQMSEYESNRLKYFNGVYAGDLFLSRNQHEHKQRDWNIRRGGRSTPETLIMFNEYEYNYECKIMIHLNTILDSIRLTNEQLFELYTSVCNDLANGIYKIYSFSTSYAYFGQAETNDFLKFNLIINPSLFNNNETVCLNKDQHRDEVYKIVKEIISRHVNTLFDFNKE